MANGSKVWILKHFTLMTTATGAVSLSLRNLYLNHQLLKLLANSWSQRYMGCGSFVHSTWFKFQFPSFWGVVLCMIKTLKQRKMKFKPRINIYPEMASFFSCSSGYNIPIWNWLLLFHFCFSNLQLAVFYHEHVFTKDPGTNRATPWHHDQAYYPFDGWKVTEFKICNIFISRRTERWSV